MYSDLVITNAYLNSVCQKTSIITSLKIKCLKVYNINVIIPTDDAEETHVYKDKDIIYKE